MHHILESDYGIHVKEKAILFNKEAYLDDNYVYFIMSCQDEEMIYMEQAALAYFLYRRDYQMLAHPIRNNQSAWFIAKDEKQLMVMRVEHHSEQAAMSHGHKLATFHQIGSTYEFEPTQISSYGQWKNFWVEKLTLFETHFEKKAAEESDAYYRLVMDILPYIIGISENAIQYISESETDSRYNNVDQGSITFQRYYNNLCEPIIWFHDLSYDHPTRDLAEYIRYQYLLNEQGSSSDITTFLENYQQIRPLSAFSWRQLYGRLIYPIHFFDCFEKGLVHGENANYAELNNLVRAQTNYEGKLRSLFNVIEDNYSPLEIPTLTWL